MNRERERASQPTSSLFPMKLIFQAFFSLALHFIVYGVVGQCFALTRVHVMPKEFSHQLVN
jgi:hypothetical protein